MRHILTIAAMLGFSLAPATMAAANTERSVVVQAREVTAPVSFNATRIDDSVGSVASSTSKAKVVHTTAQAPAKAESVYHLSLVNCHPMPLATGGSVEVCDAK